MITFRKYAVILGFCFLFPTAASAQVSLNDIETAVIQNDYAKAQDLARTFISQNPPKKEIDEAQYYLGLSLLRSGQPLQAEEVFHGVIRYDPEEKLRDQAYIGLIDVHFSVEHFEEALKEANDLLEKSPQSEFKSLIYLKLARGHLKLAQWEPAEKYLKKILSEFPNSVENSIARRLLEEKHYFAVQIGAFVEQERANRLVKDLQAKGEYAYVVETTDQAGRKFFRVRVGQFSVVHEAKQLQGKLAESGFPTQIYP
ncbi:MAG: hypothetical protein A2Z88_00895 [Omnitrophica WOR_2 bacterium GWA2_47_8]|nr:MAG: hypothetical protein A2Z88_00895 [Omnitrophica WOR_2 bacterium GWA2_47_8]